MEQSWYIKLRIFGKGLVRLIGNIMHTLLFKFLLPKKYRGLSKQKIYSIIFKSDTPAGKRFDIWLLIFIGLNLLLLVVDSSPRITGWVSFALKALEWVLTIIFTFEYYLRIYCLRRPWKYVFSFYGIIDFLSIFPAYLSLLIPATQTLTVLRILRTLRVFRIFKMQRFVNEGRHLLNALMRSAYKIIIFMLFVFITAVILGAVMYMFESKSNPAFSSIPQGVYWAVVTITTVGYGDITPVTHAGRFVAMAVMLLGYSIIAVPTGIVVGESLKERRLVRDDEQETDVEKSSEQSDMPTVKGRCPHCGYEETDADSRYCSRCGTRLNKVSRKSWMDDFFA